MAHLFRSSIIGGPMVALTATFLAGVFSWGYYSSDALDRLIPQLFGAGFVLVSEVGKFIALDGTLFFIFGCLWQLVIWWTVYAVAKAILSKAFASHDRVASPR